MIHKLLPLLFLTAALPVSHAQTAPAETKVMGWSKTGNLGANLSFSSSEDVVGQTDGSSQTYGLNLKAGFNRLSEGDEWRNDFSLQESTTKTPSVPSYLKSGDELKIATTYLYFIPSKPQFGPYVKAEAAAPMFKGENVQAAPVVYRVNRANGTSSTVAGTSIRLTDGFKPLTTKESIGAFWKAVEQDNLKIEVRVGAAALQIDADGQFTVGGKNAAGETEVNELRDVSQAGLETALGIKGKIDEKSNYEFGAETMTPFINNKQSGDDREAFRLTNISAFAKLNSNITSWASFGYNYKLKIEPQLVDRAQQIHLLVLNVSYNLF